LLGAFEDGELEPNEMQDVARHLATCRACEDILSDYNSIGRELREIITIPPLDGFAASVVARIKARPVPLRERIEAFFSGFNQRLVAGLAMVSMAGAVAVLTAIIITPYIRQHVGNGNGNVSAPMAKVDSAGSANLASATQQDAQVLEAPQQLTSTGSMHSGDSRAVISRLESEVPSVAVWSEPENDTTVIWLPQDSQP
jgi:anti-sigma factor RsiW